MIFENKPECKGGTVLSYNIETEALLVTVSKNKRNIGWVPMFRLFCLFSQSLKTALSAYI